MAIEILPLEETDLPAYAHIHSRAFTTGISPFLTSDRDAAEKSMLERDRKSFATDPSAHLLKAVDTETGAVLACAKWSFCDHERSAEEVAEAVKKPPAPPEANAQAWDDLFGWLEDVRIRLKGGQRCWYLHILVADAAHRGRGAGGQLIKWGCDRADEVDLPAWLEATAAAKPLYERYGFEEVERKVFDLTKYGGVGEDWNIAMYRKKRSDRERSIAAQ